MNSHTPILGVGSDTSMAGVKRSLMLPSSMSQPRHVDADDWRVDFFERRDDDVERSSKVTLEVVAEDGIDDVVARSV